VEVKLISFTPDPELLAAAAARLCYRDVSAAALMQELGESDVERLLDIVISSGHHSVIEHITFTFAIDGVSRVLTHQLVRHRVGIAFSQQSQRYVSVESAPFVTPRAIRRSETFAVEYAQLMQRCMDLYRRMMLDPTISAEDARFALPQAVETRLVMTANLRQLIHMYAINACFRSQWEFRQLMFAVKAGVRRVSPRLAREMRIKCFASGSCDEEYICNELAGRMPRRASTAPNHAEQLDNLARLSRLEAEVEGL